jgi:hypothetical protein
VAASLADMHTRHKELEIICKSLLPRGSQPVEAGEDVIGKSLDIQCSWPELRYQSIYYYIFLFGSAKLIAM